MVSTLVLLGGGPLAASAGAEPVTPSNRIPKSESALSPRLTAVAGAADRSARGSADAASLPIAGPGSLLRHREGQLLVDVLLDDPSPERFEALTAVGATVTASIEGNPRVTVAVDPSDLQKLAAAPGVRSVDEILAPKSNACPTGTVDEGDVQMNSAVARTTFGVNGNGVKVGVLSDSYNVLGGAPADIATGDLPGTGNTCGFSTPVQVVAEGVGGMSDEGRAMAQIVHDLAPGASLSFATANGGEAAFANQIRALQTGGAKVIVDDIGYFAEPMFQDGVISQAVRDVVALGSTYFSAAGNANVILGGKDVGSYEAAAYRPTTCPTAVANVGETDCHDFNSGAGVDNGNVHTVANGGQLQVSFGWNEPQFGITSDFDAFVLDAGGNIVDSSTSNNITGQRAFEFLDFTNNTGSTQNYRIVMARWQSTSFPKFKFILQTSFGLNAVQWNTSTGPDVIGPTVFGHSAVNVPGMGTIGAVRYNNSAQPETFSGRGPATYCWGAVVGSLPAAPIAPCQTDTIDVLATDGSQNSFFGQFVGTGYRFFGTSASAPHAAAVAALQLQARPCRTPAQIMAAQRASGVPVGAFGQHAAGSGMLNAVGAINNLATCSPATHFQVVAPSSVTSGQVTSFTVTALDAANQKVTNYSGTVHFTSNDGSATLPANTTLNLGTGTFNATLVSMGNRTITATDTVTASITGTSNQIVVSNPLGYHPVTPFRILETRAALGALQYSTPWGQFTQRTVHVTGGVVPDTATAVVLNVTAVSPTATSDLRIWPTGQPPPNASNLNFAAGQTIANLVIARVGTSGNVEIYNNSGNVHVLADVVGWIDNGTGAGDRYIPMAPVRILETRPAQGALQYSTPWGQFTQRTVHVTGNGVPSNATAVVMNVTAVSPTASSDLRVWPSGQPAPNASNLNFAAGQTIPNLVIARVGTGGNVEIYNNSGNVDVLADVVGYFQPVANGGNGYHPMVPVRLLETRPALGALQYSTPWGQFTQRTVHVTGGGVPSNATAVVLNITAVGPTAGSDLRVWPTGQAPPNASSLNFAAGQTVANLVIARVGTNGNIEIYNNSGSVDVLADVVGFYT